MSMKDPVSGFEYPIEWTTGLDQHLSEGVRAGLFILTSDGTVLRRGFTTGTTAAAAAKAAVLSLKKTVSTGVYIFTPAGIRVFVPASGEAGHGICTKDSGDYPNDVTAGIKFHAKASPDKEGVIITTGPGIGVWARETPRYKIGSPAISPPALKEINCAIQEAMEETGLHSVRVELSAEKGESIAKKTLNEKIGVTQGISVLGSTGFVEPWDDHLEGSVLARISASSRVVLTTGRVGLKYSRLLFPSYDAILVGSKLGTALKKATGEIIICGLPALILKYLNPQILVDSGFGSVEEMIGTPEFHWRADKALSLFCRNHPQVRIILLDREGKIIKEAP